MTITSKYSEVEVYYNSDLDKDSAQLTVPDKNGVLQIVHIALPNIPELEDALLDFQKLFIKVARKEALM